MKKNYTKPNKKKWKTTKVVTAIVLLCTMSVLAIFLIFSKSRELKETLLTSISRTKTNPLQIGGENFRYKYKNFDTSFLDTAEALKITDRIPALATKIQGRPLIKMNEQILIPTEETRIETDSKIPCIIQAIPAGEDEITFGEINETARSAHFQVCYTTKSDNPHRVEITDTNPSDNIPDYVNIILDEAEKAWTIQVEEYEMKKPKFTTEDIVQIFVYSSTNTSGSYGYDTIYVDNNQSKEFLRNIIQHEFFHAVQTTNNKLALSHETDASYVGIKLSKLAQTTNGKLDVLAWISERFDEPWNHLGSTRGNVEYGTFLFIQFLGEFSGLNTTLIPTLAEGIENGTYQVTEERSGSAEPYTYTDYIKLYEDTMKTRSTPISWEQGIMEYHVWNLLTGPLALTKRDRGYSNAIDYWTTHGSVAISAAHKNFPTEGNLDYIGAGGSRYIAIYPNQIQGTPETLILSVTPQNYFGDADPSVPLGVSVVKIKSNLEAIVEHLGTITKTTDFTLENPKDYAIVYYIFGNVERGNNYSVDPKVYVRYFIEFS